MRGAPTGFWGKLTQDEGGCVVEWQPLARWSASSGGALSDRQPSHSAHAEEATKWPSRSVRPSRRLLPDQRRRTLCGLMRQGVDEGAAGSAGYPENTPATPVSTQS
jgi:hypothetical protein